jgi:HlyD family secretion protein
MMERGRIPETKALDVPEPTSNLDLSGMEPTEEELPVREKLPTLERPRRRVLLAPTRISRQSIARAARTRAWQLSAAVVLVALLIGLGAAVVHSFSPQVLVAKAKQGNLTISFPTIGTLQSASYDATFTGAGRVAEVDVNLGDQVTSGQTLAKLDTTLLQDAVNQAQAAVNGAQTALNDASANVNQVQAQTSADLNSAYDVEQKAIGSCGGRTACIQAAQDAYAAAQAHADSANATAQAAVDAAQSQLTTAQAQLQTAQDNLAGATLTAPHDGTVAAIYGTVGSTAGHSDTPFIRIVDLNALQVVANVSVANVGRATKGEAVDFTVPVMGKQVFHGTVGSVTPLGETAGSGLLTYPVVIDVDPASIGGANILPGMGAKVTIVVTQRFGVTLIPASAVAFAQAATDPKRGGFLTHKQVSQALSKAQQDLLVLQDQGADLSQDQPTPSYVLKYVKGQWVPTPVVLGLTDGKSYEVLSGLSNGDSIVTGETNSPVTVPAPTPTPAQ